MANMKDVAKKAGVSTATVSHVINETRFVKDETKSKVLKAMDKLNYHPNSAARSLRSQKSNIIGLLVPDVANSFFMTLVKGVENVARKNGYNLFVSNSDDDLNIEKEQLKIFNSQLIDGLIMRTTTGNHSFLEESLSNYPTVFVDCIPDGYRKADCVLVDNVGGTYEAINMLIKRGHHKIGIIAGIAGLTSSEERLEGYKKALIDNGLTVDNSLIKMSNSRIDTGYTLMKELLEENDISAVFTGNNLITIGAMKLIKEKQLEIPADIALIGFDDREWAQITDPPISVVKQSSYEMGRRAAKLLIKRIEGKGNKGFKEYRLPTEVIIRDSC